MSALSCNVTLPDNLPLNVVNTSRNLTLHQRDSFRFKMILRNNEHFIPLMDDKGILILIFFIIVKKV